MVCGARKRHLAARNKNRHYSRGAIDVKPFDRMKVSISAFVFPLNKTGPRNYAKSLTATYAS
jgi:hypothetical protein